MNHQRRVETIFLTVVILSFAVIVSKITPPSVGGKHVKMIVTKNKKPVPSLDITPTPDYSMETTINTVDFPDGEFLNHATLGRFGFQTDFFADFNTRIIVNRTGNCFFKIGSDDGFRLFIDSKVIAEFIKDRPYEEHIYSVALKQGIHQIRLKYFQGYGRLGLRAYYRFEDEAEWFLVGKNSRFVEFKSPDDS